MRGAPGVSGGHDGFDRPIPGSPTTALRRAGMPAEEAVLLSDPSSEVAPDPPAPDPPAPVTGA